MTDQAASWDAGFEWPESRKRESEPPCGRCEWCRMAQSAFDNLLNIADGLWRRYQTPEENSFAAKGRYLHRTVCTHIRQVMPTEHARLEGQAYDAALQKWAHEHHDYNSECAARRYSEHLLLHIMTPVETQEWIASRIGPRGGPDYRLCKVCRPEVPTVS